MLKKSKKFITSMLSSCLIMGVIPISNITVNAEGKSYKVDLNKINPVVQDLKELGEGFSLTDTIELVGSDTADSQAVKFLKDLLETNNIKVNLVNREEEVNYSNTVIILGEATGNDIDVVIEDTITKLPEVNSETAFNNDEGYTLYTSNDIEGKEGGVIVIAGKDNDGTYYGTRTLEKIIQVDGTNIGVPEIDVEDYPEVKFRGIVEGFYGDPWTHENRLGLLEMSGDNKMNTYIYGPKDDPYHRSKWRDPYPQAEAEKIAELAAKATENKVDFVWAVHPGGDINFNEEDYNTLLAKFEQMYDLGVRGFAIFFDDIGGNSPQAQAGNQAWLLNKLNEDFIKVKGDVAPLILCPTEYNKSWANKNPGTYLDILGDELDPSIQVMWTGNDVMSDMDYDTLDWVNKRINREAYVWWNFPVNDYCRDKLLLGSSYGLNPNMSNAGGFTSNPMNQAEASKFALFSVSNYTWNTDAYNSERSWHNAIEDLVPEVAEDFKVFSTHNTDPGPRYRRKESEHIASTLDSFKNKLSNNEPVGTDGERIIQEFQAIKKAGRNIIENCSNKELIKEIEQWLQSFEQLGIAGENTVKAVIALQQSDYDGWWNNYISAKKALDEMARIDKHNREVLKKRGITVASQRLTPFVKSLFEDVEGLYINEVYKDDTSIYKAKPYTSLKDKGSMDNMLDKDEGTYWYSQALQEVGDYYGVDLGKVIPITDINILQGRNDNDHDIFHKGILEYSIDGENWTTIGAERTGIRISEENLNIEARYVRYRATYAGIPGGKPDLWTAIREFTVNKNSDDKIFTIESTIPGDIDKSADGKMDTAFEGERDAQAGDSITYKLTSAKELKNIHILQDDEFISNGRVSIRTVDNEWIEVGVLDKAFNNINLQSIVDSGKSNKILDIKISWDGNAKAPKIYEINALAASVTKPPINGVKPDKPEELSISNTTDSSITISWLAPKNIPVKEYIIYKDGIEVAIVKGTETRYTAEGLKTNTLYGFKVVAVSNDDLKSRPIAVNGRTEKVSKLGVIAMMKSILG